MKATCPEDPKHRTFLTTVHVAEEWVVDRNGDFLEVYEDTVRETTHGPHPDNEWVCQICGCYATVER